jgi:hypothetical protein
MCIVFGAAAMAAAPVAPPIASFDIAIGDGATAAEPQRLRVRQGDAVHIRLTSDQAGEAHLHGYRLVARVAPGSPAQWEFTARASGRYRLEWHPDADTKGGGRHGPSFATLDVAPR